MHYVTSAEVYHKKSLFKTAIFCFYPDFYSIFPVPTRFSNPLLRIPDRADAVLFSPVYPQSPIPR
ncbi:MAG: hypothetical protein UX65_C0013G0003 [Parcubacteria group bacterium GW2011_GWB1_46_8]|nr:MAG: hypothetical protein UX65_C0013G0003 [Parcubacteria group bacterium GW2011_GWB1_46_8]